MSPKFCEIERLNGFDEREKFGCKYGYTTGRLGVPLRLLKTRRKLARQRDSGAFCRRGNWIHSVCSVNVLTCRFLSDIK